MLINPIHEYNHIKFNSVTGKGKLKWRCPKTPSFNIWPFYRMYYSHLLEPESGIFIGHPTLQLIALPAQNSWKVGSKGNYATVAAQDLMIPSLKKQWSKMMMMIIILSMTFLQYQLRTAALCSMPPHIISQILCMEERNIKSASTED